MADAPNTAGMEAGTPIFASSRLSTGAGADLQGDEIASAATGAKTAAMRHGSARRQAGADGAVAATTAGTEGSAGALASSISRRASEIELSRRFGSFSRQRRSSRLMDAGRSLGSAAHFTS